MDRIALKAVDREVLGKKVKKLRSQGKLPGHVYGNSKEVEHVSVIAGEFTKVFKQAGETGLVDLKIGDDRVRPVLIKEVDIDPVTDKILHVGFYQVNLKEKVTVPVPIVLIGEGPESVKMGETVVLQTLSEINVQALPTDLIENIEVSIEVLREIGDSITVADLNYDRSTLNVLAEPEEVVVKLDSAVTEEMKKLLEEQEAEAAAAAAEVAETAEGAETAKGEEGAEGEEKTEGGEKGSEEKTEGQEVKIEEEKKEQST
ncbi:50S ribosomal protein L25 [Candidatus Daviesbacteria bacterium]|nr:50S ribosomal protein L25 [Candidatus Daviesbacteria bacterium]